MSMDELRRQYQAGLAGRASPAPDVTVEQLEALVAHRLPEPEAMALLDRIMADEGLRREYELLRSIHEAGYVSPRLRRWAPLALAATLLLAVGGTYLVQRARVDHVDQLRGPAGRVELVAPADDAVVSLPTVLSWRPVAGALRYRVEILDGEGEPVMVGETVDTVLAVSVADVETGGRYQWWVEARFPSGSERSPARRITFATP